MQTKHWVTLAFSVVALILTLIYNLPLITNLAIILLFVVIYFYISEIFKKQEEKEFIKHQLLIAKELILDTNTYAILIVRDNKILWANDFAYDEFPILTEKRDIAAIKLDELDIESKFTYLNKNYHCNINHNIYHIRNVTTEERELKILNENKPNIAYLHLDNYDSLSQMLSTEKFVQYEQILKSTLYDYFSSHNIQYVALSNEKYQLIIPSSVVEELRKDKFHKLTNLTEDVLDSDKLVVTISLGLAMNYDTAKENAEKATDALELAINRGGSQVVLFNNEEREFFGGRVNVVSGSAKMKARLMANTLLNVASKRDVIYLMTHQRPDSDGLASIILMKEFLKTKTNAEIKILIDKDIEPKLKIQMDMLLLDVGYYVDVVVDHTKRNLLLILDTQVQSMVSNEVLLDEIEDVIVLDHHQTPIKYIDHTLFSWIESTSSSTTELVVEILNVSNIHIDDKNIANFALLGIITDTNNFNYRTSASTFEIVSYLVNSGGKIDEARKLQYVDFDMFSKINTLLSNAYLMDSFSILRTQIEKDDVILSICANTLTEVEGVVGAIVVSEIKDNVNKVKIRTDGSINARELIEPYGGGGHMRQAAGVLNDEKVHLMLLDVQEKIKGD